MPYCYLCHYTTMEIKNNFIPIRLGRYKQKRILLCRDCALTIKDEVDNLLATLKDIQELKNWYYNLLSSLKQNNHILRPQKIMLK